MTDLAAAAAGALVASPIHQEKKHGQHNHSMAWRVVPRLKGIGWKLHTANEGGCEGASGDGRNSSTAGRGENGSLHEHYFEIGCELGGEVFRERGRQVKI